MQNELNSWFHMQLDYAADYKPECVFTVLFLYPYSLTARLKTTFELLSEHLVQTQTEHVKHPRAHFPFNEAFTKVKNLLTARNIPVDKRFC